MNNFEKHFERLVDSDDVFCTAHFIIEKTADCADRTCEECMKKVFKWLKEEAKEEVKSIWELKKGDKNA